MTRKKTYRTVAWLVTYEWTLWASLKEGAPKWSKAQLVSLTKRGAKPPKYMDDWQLVNRNVRITPLVPRKGSK